MIAPNSLAEAKAQALANAPLLGKFRTGGTGRLTKIFALNSIIRGWFKTFHPVSREAFLEERSRCRPLAWSLRSSTYPDPFIFLEHLGRD